MGRKKKKETIGTISSSKLFDMQKPLYDGYKTGYGTHGDTKYNRRKQKKELRKIIDENR